MTVWSVVGAAIGAPVTTVPAATDAASGETDVPVATDTVVCFVVATGAGLGSELFPARPMRIFFAACA